MDTSKWIWDESRQKYRYWNGSNWIYQEEAHRNAGHSSAYQPTQTQGVPRTVPFFHTASSSHYNASQDSTNYRLSGNDAANESELSEEELAEGAVNTSLQYAPQTIPPLQNVSGGYTISGQDDKNYKLSGNDATNESESSEEELAEGMADMSLQHNGMKYL
jgi:hypothetical protein